MKKTVLLVEDDMSLTNAIKTKLEKSGFAVVCADNSGDAMKRIHDPAVPIDAIWLDHYLLGTGTGLDILEKTKNSKVYKHIPAFIVSNTASPEKRHAYLKLGATQFYIKAEHRLEEIISDMRTSLAAADLSTGKGTA